MNFKDYINLSFNEQKFNRLASDNKDYISELKKFLEKIEHKNIQNIIHVAGTNGKGSTCNFIKNILEEHGYKVNLFTSPHLIDINERFYIKKNLVTNHDLDEAFEYIKFLDIKNELSPFEIMTFMAIYLFNKNKADFNIFEVGLGGRLDATNIFENKLISVITSISLDHQTILGNSILEIAKEKLGIVENNSILLTSNYNKEILMLYQNYCYENNVDFSFENKNWFVESNNIYSFNYISKEIKIKDINLNLKGKHQFHNASLAISSFLKISKALKINFNLEKIQNAVEKTKWRGRFEQINLSQKFAEIYIDAAHNQDGIEKLLDYLKETKNEYKKTVVIFSMLDRKKVEKNFEVMNFIDKFYFTKIDEKFISLDQALNIFNTQIEEIDFKNINNIINQNDFQNTRVIFFGSIYFIGVLKK